MGKGRRPRILVVEDDYLTARRLVRDLVQAGFDVIGPFADPAKARSKLIHADGAILDLVLGNDTSLAVARDAAMQGCPFIFYSGLAWNFLPPLLQTAGIYGKPSPIGTLMHDLNTQCLAASDDDDIAALLPLLLCRARRYAEDEAKAAALVEIVLEKAITRLARDDAPDHLQEWLLSFMHDLARKGWRETLQ